MTNVAFTSLVILVLAFPGYVFLASYFSNEFTRQVLARSWTDDLAKAIIFSLPFHIVGIFIVEWLQHSKWIHHTLNFEIAFRVVAGEFSNTGPDYTQYFSQALGRLYQNWQYVFFYYVALLFAAWGFGHLCRHVVWENELDVRFPRTLGFTPWVYSILGRGQLEGVPARKTIVWVDALTDEPTEVAGKTRIYRGLVAGFTTDEKGSLRDLFVTAARRSKFKEVDGKYEFSWQRINPGDYFLIRYSEIKNLNITYRSVDDPTPADEEVSPVAAVQPSETSAPADQTSPTS